MNKLFLAFTLALGLTATVATAPAQAKEEGVRMMAKIEVPNDAGNPAIRNGSMAKDIQMIAMQLHPEAAYFTMENGHRCAYFIFHMKDSSQMPSMFEPAYQHLNAVITCQPVMAMDDLKMGMSAMMKAHE